MCCEANCLCWGWVGRQIRENPCVPALCLSRLLVSAEPVEMCSDMHFYAIYTVSFENVRHRTYDNSHGEVEKTKQLSLNASTWLNLSNITLSEKKQITRYVNYYACLRTPSHTVYEGKCTCVCLHIYNKKYTSRLHTNFMTVVTSGRWGGAWDLESRTERVSTINHTQETKMLIF